MNKLEMVKDIQTCTKLMTELRRIIHEAVKYRIDDSRLKKESVAEWAHMGGKADSILELLKDFDSSIKSTIAWEYIGS